MKKGLAVLGATIAGGLTTGIVSGMVVNRALKYKPEDLEKDLAKKDTESIKKNLKFKDKVITGLSFGAGLALVALGGAAAGSVNSDKDEDDSSDAEVTINYYDCVGMSKEEVEDTFRDNAEVEYPEFETYEQEDEGDKQDEE
ncbi:MAG: hypothetical protein RR370_03245 [Synergistaceae bacterium]